MSAWKWIDEALAPPVEMQTAEYIKLSFSTEFHCQHTKLTKPIKNFVQCPDCKRVWFFLRRILR